MREIKFRFRIKALTKQGYKEWFEFCTLEELIKGHPPVGDTFEIVAKDQFTGLLDKNGKEIYEVDVVKNLWWNVSGKFIGDIWQVKFGEYDNSDLEYGSKGLGFYVENNNGEQETINGLPQDKGIEIIGNIYENPELLK